MKTCIAYFSRSGNTKIAAEYLADKIGAKAIELSDKTNYKGFIGFMKGGFNASKRKTANIDTAVFKEISKFERIILATPVWAGKTTPVMNAALENVDFEGKDVYVITLQADPSHGGSEERCEFYRNAIEAKKGKLKACFPLNGSPPGRPTMAKEELIAQIDASVEI